LEVLKAVLVGLAVVLGTAVVVIVSEVVVTVIRLPRQSPEMSYGIDILSVTKQSLLTPTGLIAAAVIFVLTVLLMRRARP
jgi:hypothetical protein